MSWPKHLQVDKRIVVLLSASTYESFPKALREAVSNAYDADATRVDIEIRPQEDYISITDNGSGMTPEEFDFFLRIAGRQRGRSRRTHLGRTRIGQFGIGFLSVFPFCRRVEVESTVPNSPAAFRATIPAELFTAEAPEPEDVTSIAVSGTEFQDSHLQNRHYTKLTLSGLTYLVRRYLETKPPKRRSEANSISHWEGTERLRWELAETLPVPFDSDSKLGDGLTLPTGLLAVFLNGRQIFRNDYSEEVLEFGTHSVDSVNFSYAIGTPWKAVHPYEARGIKVRLHGVGVGSRSYFDLQVAGRTFSRIHWLTGEVEITQGLDESIALNRDNFTATESYDAFREFFRERLRHLAYRIEEIDVKRRAINKLGKSEDLAAGPKLEEIKRHAEDLRGQGFRVDVVDRPSRDKDPVTVDIERRVVTIQAMHPSFTDSLKIGGVSHSVRYTAWDYRKAEAPACRISADGIVEINKDYPPFAVKGTGDILRKVQVILAFAEREATSKGELFSLVQRKLLQEFGDGLT